MTRKLHGPAGPSKQQMQSVLLALLVLVGAVVMFVQFAPGHARGHARDADVSGESGSDVRMTLTSAAAADAQRSTSPQPPMRVMQRRELAVTWPVEVSRDPFTWEKLQPPTKTEVAQAETAQVDPASIAMHAQQSLTLQAIVMGSKPRALINSTLVHPDGVIGGYVLTQIETRAVVVSRQGVSVRIALQ